MITVSEPFRYSLETILLTETPYDPDRNIVGFGFGQKIRQGLPIGQDALRVYVRNKMSWRDLLEADRIPIKSWIPLKDQLSPEDVFDVERRPQSRPPRRGEIWTDVIESPFELGFQAYTRRYAGLMGGISIGLEHETTGTLGYIFRNAVGTTARPTREFYLLTAGHVLDNYGKAGSVYLCQPGAQDYTLLSGSSAMYRVAEVVATSGWPFSITGTRIKVDAGIARTTGGHTETLEMKVAECGAVSNLGTAEEGMLVKKVGRTTGLTFGKITDLNSSFTIRNPLNPRESVILSDQITTTAMSRDGDSGAVLLDESNRLIGLLVAGTEDKSIFTPIDAVTSALNITLF
jgi:hypothetical protein